MSLLYLIIIGSVAGYVGGRIMRGKGFGWVGNIIVGIIGAVLGGWIFTQLGIEEENILYEIASAVVGAVIFLIFVGLFSKK
ncbi:MAG: GlsB/YeaQ/YmgE family stress response membrane protein [Fimbriimonadaceae bacterium]|nr:GlsB/YeaQ/YmgE family stress response membrane protein [Chitinophagales bacterium]